MKGDIKPNIQFINISLKNITKSLQKDLVTDALDSWNLHWGSWSGNTYGYAS